MSVASLPAAVRTASKGLATWGEETVVPDARGNRAATCSASSRSAVRSVLTVSSNGAVVPSAWPSSPSNRWTGSTCGWPDAVARWTALDRASWLFVVNLSMCVMRGFLGFELGTAGAELTEHGGRRRKRLREVYLQCRDSVAKCGDLVLQFQDALNPGEVDAFVLGQPLDFAEHEDVP